MRKQLPSKRSVTAYHEAGHAVSVMSGQRAILSMLILTRISKTLCRQATRATLACISGRSAAALPLSLAASHSVISRPGRTGAMDEWEITGIRNLARWSPTALTSPT
jgi:hypothetical protein